MHLRKACLAGAGREITTLCSCYHILFLSPTYNFYAQTLSRPLSDPSLKDYSKFQQITRDNFLLSQQRPQAIKYYDLQTLFKWVHRHSSFCFNVQKWKASNNEKKNQETAAAARTPKLLSTRAVEHSFGARKHKCESITLNNSVNTEIMALSLISVQTWFISVWHHGVILN